MNGTYKRLAAIVGIATIIGVSIYLYFGYLNPEVAFLRSGGTLFWTTIQNNSSEMVVIKQGEAKTIPVELHFWKRLNTLFGIEFEEPKAEHGGLYNPPDGLEISFNLDGAFVQVANEKVVEILDHKDLRLEPSQIEYRFEGLDMVVAEEIGSITISVSKDVPLGDYYFGLATKDAGVNSPYGGNSQLLAIRVVKAIGVACQDMSLCTYHLELGDSIYPINFRFSGTIENMIANATTQTLTIDSMVKLQAI